MSSNKPDWSALRAEVTQINEAIAALERRKLKVENGILPMLFSNPLEVHLTLPTERKTARKTD